MTVEIPYLARIRAQHHAAELYPTPSYGAVVDGRYVPLSAENLDQLVDLALKIDADAAIYSKPDELGVPDAAEMQLQSRSKIAFGVMGGTPATFQPAFMWGETLETAPLIGRPFVHGIWDCYSLVRDAFRAGQEGMTKQGMKWHLPPIEMPDIPRNDAWWDDGQDLYMDWLKPAGFVEITETQARPGDGFLMKVRSKVLNHAGLLVDDNAILHHLPTRLSRRENGGIWYRQIGLWVRYQG